MIQVKLSPNIGKDRVLKVSQAAKFYMDKLLSKRMVDNTYLEIQFVDMDKSISGFCQIHELCDNDYKPKDFLIELNINKGIRDNLITLAHEMVHLMQFRTLKLRHRNGYTRYGNRVYRKEPDYQNQLWEKEAYKLEKVLYEEYKSTQK